MISIVIPIYDEEESIPLLAEKVSAVIPLIKDDVEVLYINDGSSDMSQHKLEEVVSRYSDVKVIQHIRNFGQTAAMMTGFKLAKGSLVVTMDADLQNDPADIPILLAKIEEGYDVVCGWRKKRQDNMFSRVFISRLANWIISKVTGVQLHDYGCTLKVFKKDILENISLIGDMHRFIPIYCYWEGARIAEIPVRHYKRQYGQSKYGLDRIFKVISDLFYLRFVLVYVTRPMHFFGKLGFYSILSGSSVAIFVLVRKFYLGGIWISPLLLIGFFLIGMGILILLFGLIAEIVTRLFLDTHLNYDPKRSARITTSQVTSLPNVLTTPS